MNACLFFIRKKALYIFFSGWWDGSSCYILQFCHCHLPFDCRGRALPSLSLSLQPWRLPLLPAVLALQCCIFHPGTCRHNWPCCGTLRTWILRLVRVTVRLKKETKRRRIRDERSAGALLPAGPSLIPQSHTFFLVSIIPPPTQHSAEPPTQRTTTESPLATKQHV